MLIPLEFQTTVPPVARVSEQVAVLVALLAGLAAAHPGYRHDVARLNAAMVRAPSAATLLARAQRYRLLTEYPAALADVARAERLGAPADAVAVERGLTLEAQGQLQQALPWLERATAGPQPAVEALDALGRVRGALEDWPGAVAAHTRALERFPTPERVLAAATARRRTGDDAGALEVLRHGLASLGGAVVLRQALVEALLAAGAWQEAAQVCRGGIRAGTMAAEWQLCEGRALEAGLDRAGARRAYAAARESLGAGRARQETPLQREMAQAVSHAMERVGK